MMEGRQRSPSYPSTPLEEAIDLIRKIHNLERTNSVEREVAAKAMGYTGISGRSATVLSNLIQFGLLEKTGKNEVRVTRRAIDILYPDTDASKAEALCAAARDPELFKSIAERFTDGMPSVAALHSYLVRQGFTNTAVQPATRAFLETFVFLENALGSEGNSHRRDSVQESQQDQSAGQDLSVNAAPQSLHRADFPSSLAGKAPLLSEGPDVRFSQKMIWLAGTVRDQAEADELVTLINALKPSLPLTPSPAATPTDDGDVFS